MLNLATGTRIFVAAGATDMRKGFDGLQGLVSGVLAQDPLCEDPAKFSRGIADTRNYYTHFTDELRPKALPPVATYWASEKLSFLMRIVLFKYLGIDEAVIVKQMSEHHRLLQRIFYSKGHPESMKVD